MINSSIEIKEVVFIKFDQNKNFIELYLLGIKTLIKVFESIYIVLLEVFT